MATTRGKVKESGEVVEVWCEYSSEYMGYRYREVLPSKRIWKINEIELLASKFRVKCKETDYGFEEGKEYDAYSEYNGTYRANFHKVKYPDYAKSGNVLCCPNRGDMEELFDIISEEIIEETRLHNELHTERVSA